MSIIRINADGPNPVLHGTSRALSPVLHRALDHTGPITVMIHGYSFAPYDPRHCPHTHIFSLDPPTSASTATSWPLGLGYGSGDPDEGIAIAFGWMSRGTVWQALQTSQTATRALATLIGILRTLAPDRPVHLVGHSMGTHLALSALPLLRQGDLGRILLLNGATYQQYAKRMLQTPAGRASDVINVISAENRLYDKLFEWAIPALSRDDKSIGQGIDAHNAVNLRIDMPSVLDSLAQEGFQIHPSRRWPCHWSTYLRDGTFPFYRALIRTPERLPLQYLQALSAPSAPTTPPKQPMNWRGMRLSTRLGVTTPHPENH